MASGVLCVTPSTDQTIAVVPSGAVTERGRICRGNFGLPRAEGAVVFSISVLGVVDRALFDRDRVDVAAAFDLPCGPRRLWCEGGYLLEPFPDRGGQF